MGRIIGAPRDEGDLGARAFAALELVRDVVDGVAAADALLAPLVLALGVDELLAEGRPVVYVGRLLDDDLFPVVADLVDDVLGVLAQLELVEGADALRRDGNTGGGLVFWGTGEQMGRRECRRGGSAGRCLRAEHTQIEPARSKVSIRLHWCTVAHSP